MNHSEKIKSIIDFLKVYQDDKPVSFIKKTVSHQVPKPGLNQESRNIFNIANLDEILEIDPVKKIGVAEPGVTFADLVKACLKYNLVPGVVPELKTITIGGAIAGCSVESTSFRRGGFHDTCLEYEVIDAQGELHSVSRDQEAEVFGMLHGTFGTLGLITKLVFKLFPAQPYVRLNYETYSQRAEWQAAMNAHCQAEDIAFMDALIFAPDKYVLCLADFVTEAPYLNSYQGQKVYYQSAGKRSEDYLTTFDYFFRYDADCHWVSRNYGLENPIWRFLFGRLFLSSSKMLKLAKKLSFIFKNLEPDVVVDVFVPIARLNDFLDFYKVKFNYWPLWIVPYKMPAPYPWINDAYLSGSDNNLFIDVAIYGFRSSDSAAYYRSLEMELEKIHGFKTLISYNYYNEAEFWRIWNKTNYDRIKELMDPKNIFRNLYSKTRHSK